MTLEDKHFVYWETQVFGYGYGTGEEVILPELKKFLFLCSEEKPYAYEDFYEDIRPAVTWLLINVLCKCGVIEYGGSPRNGWLTDRGIALKRYLDSVSKEYIISLISDCDTWTDEYTQYTESLWEGKLVNPFYLEER